MSADYSFYALLCGFMPRPEGVQKRETKVSRFFVVAQRVKQPALGRTGGVSQLTEKSWGGGWCLLPFCYLCGDGRPSDNTHADGTYQAFSAVALVSHGGDCPFDVHSLLHPLVCPDGPAHLDGRQRGVMVHPLRVGQDDPIRRTDYSGRGGCQAIERLVEKSQNQATGAIEMPPPPPL